MSIVKDMANRLLATCNALYIRLHQASNFVKRYTELQTHFQCKYNYQRAKCKDLEVICGWFELVQNTIAKYGINDADIYNFNKTRFIIGVISTAMVVTSLDRQAKAKIVQPSNQEWVTVIQGVSS